jgi:hypothetical protein
VIPGAGGRSDQPIEYVQTRIARRNGPRIASANLQVLISWQSRPSRALGRERGAFPAFDREHYAARIRDGEGRWHNFRVSDYAYAAWRARPERGSPLPSPRE